jgi:hypothetical protein
LYFPLVVEEVSKKVSVFHYKEVVIFSFYFDVMWSVKLALGRVGVWDAVGLLEWVFLH